MIKTLKSHSSLQSQISIKITCLDFKLSPIATTRVLHQCKVLERFEKHFHIRSSYIQHFFVCDKNLENFWHDKPFWTNQSFINYFFNTNMFEEDVKNLINEKFEFFI